MLTYDEALARLHGLRRFGVRPGLDGMRRLLAALGEPQRELAVVHLAGTNGKGSTAAFIEAMLRAGGRRTGLYTSPHLLRFTERIRLGGVEISPERAAALTERVLDAVEAGGFEATFFEVATAMAFVAFAEDQLEVAVVEAGLGGRLDATNVIERPCVTVVTGVALDHTDVLGATLTAIAGEKAGIWKAGVPAVLACEDPEARAVLLGRAAAVGAPAYLLGRDFDETGLPPLALAGAHQRRNAALARRAVTLLSPELRPDAAAIARGLGTASWPGRLEELAPDVLVDAAHNGEGARALAAALAERAAGPGQRRSINLVVGVVTDKDAAPILAALTPWVERVIAVRPPTPRGRSPEELRAYVPAGGPSFEVAASLADALARARTGGALALVAGSIFLVGQTRQLVLGEPADSIAVQDPPATSV